MTLTHRDSVALCQIAYMDNLTKLAKKGYDLQAIAKIILDDRNDVLLTGKELEYDLHQWGDFSTAEHYALLEEIAKGKDGKYPNLSNLVFKAYENDSGKTDFAACAFTDKDNARNTYMSFRGSMGNQIGDGFAKAMIGKASGSWMANYHRFLNGIPRNFDKVEAFVRAHKGDGQTFVTGFSKGAADAAAACARVDGVTGWGINGPGIAQTLTYKEQDRLVRSDFIMFMNERDIVGLVPWHIEKTVTVKHKDYFEHGRSITGPWAGHNGQTLAYDERGGFILSEKTKEAEKIEARLKEIYKENLVNGNKLGLTVYGLEFVKGALEKTGEAFQLLEQGKKTEYEAGEGISAAAGKAIIDTANKAFNLPDQSANIENEVKASEPIRKQIENIIREAINNGEGINQLNIDGAVDKIYKIYDQQQSFNPDSDRDMMGYRSVKVTEIYGTLYATWQPCKEGYTCRQQETERLKYDMPTKTYEQTRSWLLDQRLTPEEQNAHETGKELQKKRDNLENYYLDFKARGEKKGYYRFYSENLPEFMKSEGQKKHEMEKADLFRQHDELKGREEANLAACESREAKQNDPQFKKAADRAYAEMLADKASKTKRLKELEGEMGILGHRMKEISSLSKYLPETIRNKEILIKGDPKDIENVLSQSREIRAQTAYSVLEKQPDYNFETGRPHEKEWQRGIERSM